MNDDLVERLREQYGNLRSGISQHPLEAADRIEALEAEVERLREALRTYAGPIDDTWNEKPYPYWANGYPGGVFIADNTLDFGDTARAALGEKQ